MARRFQARPAGDSPVQQGEGPSTDINRMVANAKGRNTDLPAGSRAPQWGDFSDVDFMDAQNMILQVKTSFLELPSRIRNLFDNDPAQVIRFVNDPDNRDKAIQLGLAVPPIPVPKSVGEEVAEALKGLQVDLVEKSKKPPVGT